MLNISILDHLVGYQDIVEDYLRSILKRGK